MTTFSHAEVNRWFARRTIGPADHTPAELLALKRATGSTIAVCLPALDEEATIGDICRVVADELVAPGLVDELVVVDSGSSDDTIAVAAGAGARVHEADDVFPQAGAVASRGKGETLWKSLGVIESDIVVWIDSDTTNFGAHFVTRLAAPLLEDPDVGFVKGFYERPLDDGVASPGHTGGRVTEIAIRPLINLLAPELAGFIQPLSGEYAGRMNLLRQLPFSVGYDVDLMLLLDVVDRCSLDAVAQVDLGKRSHRNRPASSLGRMSFEITRALLTRLDAANAIKLGGDLPSTMVQFGSDAGASAPQVFETVNEMRPPIATFLE